MSIRTKDIEANRRSIVQNAKLAIRDIFDAVVELVTNSDDRYQILGCNGRIEIAVGRRRGRTPSILKVRDFADGMSIDVMERKLSRLGGRVSGMERGYAVRGTNSRGAKDVAALGRVIFESIASDGRYHHSEISPFFEFVAFDSEEASQEHRKLVGIAEGTGTVVTIEIDSNYSVPLHDNLRVQIPRLVRLRDIMADPQREIILRDLNQNREHRLEAPHCSGTERVSERIEVPGYPGIKGKLVIYRSERRFERDKDRFRLGGIIVKSRHAIHEATLFDSSLESDPHALWFYGRLVCPYVDELWNEFDERFERHLEPEGENPVPILDPSRRSGLTRDHPFVAALYSEALKCLRPLVEEERRREERARARIESRETRKRLDALEKAAIEFMEEYGEDEPSRDPEGRQIGSRFREKGFQLNPPFAQLVKGHSRQVWLSVLQEAFPEIEEGASVQVECLSQEIAADARFVPLERHPTQEGVLRAVWKVTAREATPASGVRVRVGPVRAEMILEVLESESDLYAHIRTLEFQRKKYRIRTDTKRKRVRVLAPLSMVQVYTPFAVQIAGSGFSYSGEAALRPRDNLGVAMCDLTVRLTRENATGGVMTATLDGEEASAQLLPVPPVGAGISIKLEDIDLINQRYRWRKNELEIAARHPSLQRYLGLPFEGFPGQESQHFRVLMAEIVADAICARLLSDNIQRSPHEYEGADWDLYYAEFSKYMTKFLPTAHKLVLPSG